MRQEGVLKRERALAYSQAQKVNSGDNLGTNKFDLVVIDYMLYAAAVQIKAEF